MKLFNFKKIYILKNIVRDIFNKKQQKDFYKLENYKKIIKIDKKTVYKYFNYLFNSDSCIDFKKNFRTKLNKKYIEAVLPIASDKSNLFDYYLDKKKFNKKIYNGLNFLRINVKNKKSFSFLLKNDEICQKPILVKNKNKKKLVILLMVDGFGYDLLKHMKKTQKFFGKLS